MKKGFLLLAASVGLLIACEKEKGPGDIYSRPGKGVFVINEGQYGQEDASLSYYGPATKASENDVCYNANNRGLGDVCQSMTIIGNRGFVVVNNSGVVPVLDTDNFKYTGQITGLESPRYVLAVSADKIYISDMKSRYITIANPNTCQKRGRIDLGGGDGVTAPLNSSEQMVKAGNNVFVCSWSYNNQLFRIDASTDLVTGSFTLPYAQPNSMVADKNGKLWIACDGGSSYGAPGGFRPTAPALLRIDPATLTVEQEFTFPSASDSPSKLTINGDGDTVYFLNNAWGAAGGAGDGVFMMSVTDNELPAAPAIPMGTHLFYGLGVDPDNSDIYVSDITSYFPVVPGTIYRYDASGATLKDSFTAGIFPGSFCFKPE